MNDIVSMIGVVIASLGGGAVVVFAFSGWLGKLWADRIMSKELENLRSEYKKLEAMHSIKFSTLHARRAEVISDIYTLLSEVENQVRILADPTVESGYPSKEDTYNRTEKLMYELFVAYSKYRIYLSEDTCQKIDEFILHSKRPLNFFLLEVLVNKQDPTGESIEIQQDLIKKNMSVWEEVDEMLPKALKSVEMEFRKTLGVLEFN